MSWDGERLEREMAVARGLIERELEGRLPSANRVDEAMRYSMFGRAKRVRPLLCLWSCEAAGGEASAALPAAAALEMVHVYSLIHDDLPAMDDDDMRRGRPSCHRAFDEATAILAGDGLLTEAFAVLAGAYEGALAGELVGMLAGAAGTAGMVGGQMLDMEAMAEGYEAPGGDALALLERLHGMKTGALLRASVMLGARVAGAEGAALAGLEGYGRAIGLAFQVTDDVLDVTASAAELGKTAGKDAEQGKLTYPAVMGLAGARERAEALFSEAMGCLDPLGDAAAPLRALGAFIVRRRM